MATATQNQQRVSAPANGHADANYESLSDEQALALVNRVVDRKPGERQNLIKKALLHRAPTIESVLPAGMRGQAERLINRAIMTFIAKPDLAECPIDKFIRCVIQAAEIGLAIDGKLCYVVRYKSTWQVQPDYKGLIVVAKRCGQIRDCYADVVCQYDSFRAYRKNDSSFLEHELPQGFGPRGKVIGSYSVVVLPDSLWRYELMSLDELDSIQRRAPSKTGPWATDVNEMRKKTVIRRLLKLYVDDPAFIRATQYDDDEDVVEDATQTVIETSGPPVGRNRLPAKSVQIVLPAESQAAEEQQYEQDPLSPQHIDGELPDGTPGQEEMLRTDTFDAIAKQIGEAKAGADISRALSDIDRSGLTEDLKTNLKAQVRNRLQEMENAKPKK